MHVVVGVYYQPPIWEHDTEEVFHKKLRNISRSAVLVLVGALNFPDINWEHHAMDTSSPEGC